MSDFDVAIIGAGPSGSSTAITLAQRGYQVVLIDRARFPRDKLCGDFLNAINWRLLQELNVSQDVLRCPHSKVSSFRLTAADGVEAHGCLPAQGERQYGLGLRRFHLDHVLLERAKSVGVTVKEGATIKSIGPHAKGWALGIDHCGDPLSLRAKVIVGADGRNSWVARRLGVAPCCKQLSGSVGFEVQVKNVACLDGSVEIHQFLGGYAGLVRVDEDRVNLCFTVNKSRLGKSVSYDSLREKFFGGNPFLQELLGSSEPVSELRSVWPVYRAARQCFGDGFLLVGDAARVTEPVTGEGIYFALKSGLLAAKTIDAALRRDNFSRHALGRYDQACRAEFRQRFQLNHVIRVLMYRPKLLSLLIRYLSKQRYLLDSLVNAVCLPEQLYSHA